MTKSVLREILSSEKTIEECGQEPDCNLCKGDEEDMKSEEWQGAGTFVKKVVDKHRLEPTAFRRKYGRCPRGYTLDKKSHSCKKTLLMTLTGIRAGTMVKNR